MKITVIGCGRWGSFIAWYLDRIGHNVTIYGLADAPSMQQLLQTRSNGLLEISPETTYSSAETFGVLPKSLIILNLLG